MANDEEDSKEIRVRNESSGGNYLLLLVLIFIIVSVGYLYYNKGGFSGIQKFGGDFVSGRLDKFISPIKNIWGNEPLATKEIKKKLAMELYNVPKEIEFGRDLIFGADIEYGDDFDLKKYGVSKIKYTCGVFEKKKDETKLHLSGDFYERPKSCIIKNSNLEELKELKNPDLYLGMKLEFSKESKFYLDFYTVSNDLDRKDIEELKSSIITEDGGPLKVKMQFSSSRKTNDPLLEGSTDFFNIYLSNNWRDGRILLKNLIIEFPNGVAPIYCDGFNPLTQDLEIKDNEKFFSCPVSVFSIEDEKIYSRVIAKASYDFTMETTSSVSITKAKEDKPKEGGELD